MVFDGQQLFAAGQVVDTDGSIGSACGQFLAIGAVGDGEDRIAGTNEVGLQRSIGGGEQLDFTDLSGSTGCDGHLFSVGREGNVVDAFGDVGDPSDHLAIAAVPEDDLVVSGTGQLFAVVAKGDGGDWHGDAIGLGGHGLRQLGDDSDQGVVDFDPGIEVGSGVDPFLDQSDLFGGERIGVLWHRAVFDHGQQRAFVGLAGGQ